MAAAPARRRNNLDLKHFRAVLEGERSRITEQLDRLNAQDETGGPAGETGELSHYDQHIADQATDTFFREQDQAIQAGLRAELHEVEAACRKLENGNYGQCDRCGGDIPVARLEVLPFALYCVRCAGQLEGRI